MVRYLLAVALWLILLPDAGFATDPAALCKAGTIVDPRDLAGLESVKRVQSFPTTPILPGGARSDVVLVTTPDANAPLSFRGFIVSDVTAAVATDVVVRELRPEHPAVTGKLVANEKSAILTSVYVPQAMGGLWPNATLLLVHCKGDQPAFLSTLDAPVSLARWSAGVVVPFLLIGYVLFALATFRSDKEQKLKLYQQPMRRYLDPVVLSAGSNGKGNISKLQALFFSVIVVGLLLYLLLRNGYLSNLSTTVLTLMGIAGVGAAASKATDTSKNRLDFSNWAWLIEHKWLPPGGLAAVNTARWRDIVVTDGEFDVYRFQMVVFSIVVGGALMFTGVNDLAGFTIPDTLLGLLGLSQIVYIGSKLAAPASCADLNDGITQLRAAERAFVESAIKNPDPTPPAGTDPAVPPRDLAAAKRRANPVLYLAYKDLASKVRLMFESVIGRTVALTDLEPAYR
jgi:hypothetical protein